MPLLSLLILLLAGAAAPLAAQTVRVEGGFDHPASDSLRALVERGRYLLLDRDSVLPASFRTEGDLLVIGADVRLEGSVDGSIAVVDGTLFVRPGARIGGRILSAGGEVYLSGRSVSGDTLSLPLLSVTTVRRTEGEYLITLEAPPPPPPVQLDGMFGLGLPTYDRVNGLTLRWGSTANLSGDTAGAVARAQIRYHSTRGALSGEVGARYPVGGELWLTSRASRGTVTNEEWIRDDLTNSLAAIALRSDTRDYYESDELSLGVETRFRSGLVAGEGRLAPHLRVRASRDRSLPARDPWSALDRSEPWRPNPAIDRGTLISLVGGTGIEWRGQTTGFLGDVSVEWAPPALGDFHFAQVVAGGSWNMQMLWGHLATVSFHTRQTLSNEAAPRQRWSFVGGPGTLSTEETASQRGDRVVFVESGYSIPVTAITLPLAGNPSLRLEHVVASAWRSDGPAPRWEQNLGAGVEFSLFHALLFVNPADGFSSPSLSLGLSLPF